MILCAIADFHRYAGLHPRFLKALEWLDPVRIAALPEGRHEILGEDLFLIAAPSARVRPRQEVRLEAHQAYIDLQVVISGTDPMGWAPLSTCRRISQPHDETKDIAFYLDPPALYVPVHAGHLAVFFPEDAHAPLAGEEGAEGGAVHKVVIKVRATA